MNANEPVAPFGWFWFESEENKSPYTQITGYTYERFSTIKPDGSAKIDEGSLIPVYTHPVKELTDEEVFNLEQQAYNLAMQVQNQKALIKQLEETQVYLYKTHDADKAEIEALKEQLRFSYDGQ